jgi:hypothetical protein
MMLRLEGFFSDQVLADDVFARLLTFPNVLITGHEVSTDMLG